MFEFPLPDGAFTAIINEAPIPLLSITHTNPPVYRCKYYTCHNIGPRPHHSLGSFSLLLSLFISQALLLHYTYLLSSLSSESNGCSKIVTMPRNQQHKQQRSTTISLILLIELFIPMIATSGDDSSGGGGGGTRFDFGTLTLRSLKLLGDAHLKNSSIRLTRDLAVPNSGAGHALYSSPVRLRHPSTRRPLPFSTYFTFSITNLNPSSIGGGLAFILSSDDRSIGDAGGYLGLINASSSSSSPSSIVAVEFDTLMDVQFEDINGNHVGVDLNSLISEQVADLDASEIDLKSGDLITAWIEYSGGDEELLEVFVSYSTVRPEIPTISFPVDLGRFINDFMFVGFSGSTQGSTEIHSVEWWSFSSTDPTSPSPSPQPSSATAESINPNNTSPTSISTLAESPKTASVRSSSCRNNRLCRQGPAAVALVATGGAIFAAAAGVGFVFWMLARKRARSRSPDDKWGILAASSEIVKLPREFTYRELVAATRGFDSARIIGHGAFGTVYKGIVGDSGAIVAVKRCIHHSSNMSQGRAEFLSELSIIATLRHRNLVQLQGWCREKGEILLVYDYMVNGSLDKALFDPRLPTLAWRHRRKVLSGVAAALAYLHHECERQVIHRDVKSSNIMLDEDYHARLGDFGLARQVDHDRSPDATITAGTMGYLAPEYLLTGRATDRTDVFSFGAVLLEVACGRRPIDGDSGGTVPVSGSRMMCSNLVEWVWGLHGEGRILEAVDRRLKGEFEEGEMRRVMMVGLACSNPDPVMRPGMRAVVQILAGEAPPPVVPRSKPSMSFSTSAVTQQLLMSLQDSVSDCKGMGFDLNLSSSSSSSSSPLRRSTLNNNSGV